MRVKLDENLPASLVEPLTELGHDVDTAPGEGLAGHPDADVWTAALSAKRILVTQDLDFSDIRVFAPGTHPGVVLVRLREPGRAALSARILTLFRTAALETWEGCFVVATDRKVRVRRPPLA
jgi:predicted nuclease of predicted toxin-antitoxin system